MLLFSVIVHVYSSLNYPLDHKSEPVSEYAKVSHGCLTLHHGLIRLCCETLLMVIANVHQCRPHIYQSAGYNDDVPN